MALIPAASFWLFTLRSSLAVAAAVLAVIVSLALTGTVAGQENGRDEVHHIGAHDLRVVPVNLNLGAGSAHFAVFVTHPDTGEPVSDARVVLVTSNAVESNPGWAFATNSPAVPERYDVNPQA